MEKVVSTYLVPKALSTKVAIEEFLSDFNVEYDWYAKCLRLFSSLKYFRDLDPKDLSRFLIPEKINRKVIKIFNSFTRTDEFINRLDYDQIQLMNKLKDIIYENLHELEIIKESEEWYLEMKYQKNQDIYRIKFEVVNDKYCQQPFTIKLEVFNDSGKYYQNYQELLYLSVSDGIIIDNDTGNTKEYDIIDFLIDRSIFKSEYFEELGKHIKIIEKEEEESEENSNDDYPLTDDEELI